MTGVTFNMKKYLLLFVTICFFCAALVAQEEDAFEAPDKPFQNHVMTALGFQAVQLEENDFVFTPSVNLQYMCTKSKGVESKLPDMIAIGAGYSQNIFTTGLGPDNVKKMQSVNLMASLSKGKNIFTSMVSSYGEERISDISMILWQFTHQLIQTDSFSFLIGGGLFVVNLESEFFVLPLPAFSFSYTNDYFYGEISMMGLNVVLLPKSMFRFNGSLGMGGFSSVRDIAFDCALAYYPLFNAENEGIRELLCVSAGIMNQSAGFKLQDKTSFGYQCYTVYGEVNATFISLRCGYNFDGKMLVDNEIKKDMYKGMFATVQAMFMF